MKIPLAHTNGFDVILWQETPIFEVPRSKSLSVIKSVNLIISVYNNNHLVSSPLL